MIFKFVPQHLVVIIHGKINQKWTLQLNVISLLTNIYHRFAVFCLIIINEMVLNLPFSKIKSLC